MRSPSFRPCLLLALLSLFAGTATAQEHPKFKDHVFFKHMTGAWTCEGDLKGTDGTTLKLKEEWKGEFLGANTLLIEGQDNTSGGSQAFKWTFIFNPESGAIEATHQAGAKDGDTERYEVLVSQDGLSVEMTGLVGSGDSKIVAVLSMSKDDHDTIRDKLTVTDKTGATVFSGELVNKRVKK